jgi:pimeloyl-ACP methyl ester carboxylesterase
VAPERLANVPVQDMHAWIGGACYLLPRPCQLLLGRQQDTAPLFAAGKTGLPLLILHGKEDLLISGAAVIENMAPKFTDCETVLLDCGHMPFYE